jgi:hypothetical protein
MQSRSIIFLFSSLALLFTGASARSKIQCRADVVSLIEKTFSAAKIQSCATRKEDGSVVYEAKGDARENLRADLYFDQNGKVLLTEKAVPNDSLPELVLAAFDTRYPSADIDLARKQVDSAGGVTYTLAFLNRGHPRDAVFTNDGRFLAEDKTSADWKPAEDWNTVED